MNVIEALRFLLGRIDYTQPESEIEADPYHVLCARVTPDELAHCREALDAATIPVPDEQPKFDAGAATEPVNPTPVFDAMGLVQPPFPEAPIITGDTPQQLDTECFQGQGGTFGGAGATVQIAEDSGSVPPEAFHDTAPSNTGASNDIDTAGGQATDNGPNPDYSASVDNSGSVSQDSGF